MEVPRVKTDSLTPSQQQAVEARGNVLVMAGAGTGKTKTLVARCLDCLARDHAALDELLVVTFTEAAAAEMRQRLRRAIEAIVAAEAGNPRSATLHFWNSQLALFDIAHIGTLHSFCLKLVREHFYELGLDPQLAILDEGEARQLASETLDEQFQTHYAGADEFSLAVQELIHVHGGGQDEKIRALILRLHHYSQTRPDAAGWLAEQIGRFSAAEPVEWRRWLPDAIADWRDEWLPVLEQLGTPGTALAGSTHGEHRAGPEAGVPPNNEKAAELAGILSRLGKAFSRELAAEVLEQMVSADGNWPPKRKTILRKPLGNIFDEAAFLASLARVKAGNDPLAEDWNWVRGHLETLLRLAQEFARDFAARKLADGVLDFHDLEQFALRLLWDFAGNQPTAVAAAWREKLKFVFVDEYQDINAAQDKIIAALSRDDAKANRFLVGDVKQSIYRFRLADPKIFRAYARSWREPAGLTIPLADNFRSREGLIDLVNSVFTPLLREEIGGVAYDAGARLRFGSPETRGRFAVAADPAPCAELLLRFKTGSVEGSGAEDDSGTGELAELGDAEREARRLAARLVELRAAGEQIWDDEEQEFRAVEWRDMAVLLRAPSGKSDIYAKEFERAGVPLVVERGGFFDSHEILDLMSLLRLLDNPLQDVPCIAVLRSPLVGCSLDELAEIRLAARGHFWTALSRSAERGAAGTETREKLARFLERFARWRGLARQVSLSRCLEQVLAETHFDDWLRAQPRGAQRHGNIERFLHLAEKFDQFQRQGLYRFLKFIEAQREAGVEPEVAAAPAGNAVRLMSIHQSKGLEFPVVALADLGKPFNQQDARGEIIFDEELGLCPRVKPPHTGRRYPSLPHWLAQRHQRREQAGEELRLLYVAMTRARDRLILSGSVTEAKWSEQWQDAGEITGQKIVSATSYADWLGWWFAQQPGASPAFQGELPRLRWRIADDAELELSAGSRRAEDQTEDSPEPPRVGGHEDKSALDAATFEKLRAMLTWEYPFDAATRRAAKSSVTTLRRQAADELADEAEPVFPARPDFTMPNRKLKTGSGKLSAADTGTAHHRFLQRLQLEHAADEQALATEAERLERENVLSPEERAVLDLKAVAAFWQSDPGRKILQQAANVRRELEFTARFAPAELDEIIGAASSATLKDEFIVVQGVADLAVLLPREIWLVDFKTDELRAGQLPAKIQAYAPQLRLYARALEKIYGRPVTNAWLHFLAAQRTAVVEL
jgi:ATP-dependent helicase/nuclease subunit A